MALQELTGDLSSLKSQSLIVPAAFTGRGHRATGAFKLKDSPALAHYINSFATVEIVGDIQVEVTGPVSSTVATSALVAFYPDKYSDAPTTQYHVVSLEGRVTVQHSLLVGVKLGTPGLAREVGRSLKLPTLVDYPPVLAYHVDVQGGTAASDWTITAHVEIVASGVSHKKTW